MKSYFFGANWKMNMSLEAGERFFEEWNILPSLPESSHRVVFFPTQYLLAYLQNLHGKTNLFGAQNTSHFGKGAVTGEITAELLVADHISYSLVGHSERRTLLGETDSMIAKKIKKNGEFNLCSVLCVGEDLISRQSGNFEDFVSQQLSHSLQGVDKNTPLVIAYEPLWAIGTGITPTDKEIETMHHFITQQIQTLGFPLEDIPIVYGGSVTASNAGDILSLPYVRGVLVGGASLKPKEFHAIVHSLMS